MVKAIYTKRIINLYNPMRSFSSQDFECEVLGESKKMRGCWEIKVEINGKERIKNVRKHLVRFLDRKDLKNG